MPVIGIAISGNAATTRPKVEAVAAETAAQLNNSDGIPEDAIEIVDGHVGISYGQPTDEMMEAVTWVAQHEGILLDPVYSGKAMAGLVALVKSGASRLDTRSYSSTPVVSRVCLVIDLLSQRSSLSPLEHGQHGWADLTHRA